MAQEPVDYDAVLADLHARRAAIDSAIAAIEQMRSVGGQAGAGGGGGAPSRPVDPTAIPDDAFFGLSIGEAAKKYLQMVKRKQSIREIAEALDRGGLPHSSSNFVVTVATMLNRAAKSDQELVRVSRGEWGLASWYGNRRPKIEAPPPKKRRRSAGRKAAPKRRGRAAREASDASDDAAKSSVKGSAGLDTGAAAQPADTTVRQLAERTLREAGSPLHMDEIIKRIEAQTGRAVKRDTLASVFSVTVRKGDTFFKVAPGVFGLIGEKGHQQTLH